MVGVDDNYGVVRVLVNLCVDVVLLDYIPNFELVCFVFIKICEEDLEDEEPDLGVYELDYVLFIFVQNFRIIMGDISIPVYVRIRLFYPLRYRAVVHFVAVEQSLSFGEVNLKDCLVQNFWKRVIVVLSVDTDVCSGEEEHEVTFQKGIEISIEVAWIVPGMHYLDDEIR